MTKISSQIEFAMSRRLSAHNYHMQGATYSEVHSKSEIDTFLKLQIPGGRHQLVGRHTAWSRERLAEQNLLCSFPEPSLLSSSCSRKPEGSDPG